MIRPLSMLAGLRVGPIEVSPPKPSCRHAERSKRLARDLRDARAKLAASDAELKRLRRALARARRAASPMPSVAPEPVRPPTLGELADVFAVLGAP